ncbi:hypothetical protein CK203_024658 [Vitis vinifera]|uniref:DUF4283 domain-containing protein n=1 Tax=Vitis vinifera TaxID=29760 RepID=A0A438IUN8_VITVI|nr:hypothetical protein CK203_024658 [Vitis vinifera]
MPEETLSNHVEASVEPKVLSRLCNPMSVKQPQDSLKQVQKPHTSSPLLSSTLSSSKVVASSFSKGQQPTQDDEFEPAQPTKQSAIPQLSPMPDATIQFHSEVMQRSTKQRKIKSIPGLREHLTLAYWKGKSSQHKLQSSKTNHNMHLCQKDRQEHTRTSQKPSLNLIQRNFYVGIVVEQTEDVRAEVTSSTPHQIHLSVQVLSEAFDGMLCGVGADTDALNGIPYEVDDNLEPFTQHWDSSFFYTSESLMYHQPQNGFLSQRKLRKDGIPCYWVKNSENCRSLWSENILPIQSFHFWMLMKLVARDLGDGPKLRYSPTELARLREQWKYSLIAKVLGKKLQLQYYRDHLLRLWSAEGSLKIIELGCEFFVLKFSEFLDYEKVRKGVPWLIHGYYIAIRPWSENFKPSEATITHTWVWARLPELPIEYYDKEVLFEIGEAIGRPIKIDPITERQEKRQICENMH